jgi:hypothetical protein
MLPKLAFRGYPNRPQSVRFVWERLHPRAMRRPRNPSDRFWPVCDVPECPREVGYQGQSGLVLLIQSLAGVDRCCSLIPGLGVKLSTIILAGPTVLSAVGACPPHDGVRRRWWINVESAVTLSGARKKSGDLTTATVPAGTSFPAISRDPLWSCYP